VTPTRGGFARYVENMPDSVSFLGTPYDLTETLKVLYRRLSEPTSKKGDEDNNAFMYLQDDAFAIDTRFVIVDHLFHLQELYSDELLLKFVRYFRQLLERTDNSYGILPIPADQAKTPLHKGVVDLCGRSMKIRRWISQ